jgi:hypothetical protein
MSRIQHNPKLILHRAKPNGDPLPDWEFDFQWDRDQGRASHTRVGRRFYRIRWRCYQFELETQEKTVPWSRIHATGMTLPDGTEVVLPRRKK